MVADEPDQIGGASKKVLAGAKADRVREYATAALGEIGYPNAVPALLRAATPPATSARPPRSPSSRSTRRRPRRRSPAPSP